ncbi:MFS transporter [Corynebacterium choanae]|uniref:Major Facilitator Superfamily protein n=1 Tax=Corynebacterium choanae TaxID=1862358 RepID=A0A3G6J969_9CORY|nr:MFS transporter [Corynebacterium choanae]AZA14536.1 Major Facilitator Superfamily protein [Corynebacterium choanae]
MTAAPHTATTGNHLWLPIALAMFTAAWGGNEFTPLLVLYRQSGDFSDFFVDLMLVSYACGVACGLLGAGPTSDRYGRRAVMMPAPLVAMAGSLAIFLGEHSALLMTVGRMLSGLAVGMAMTAGGSWIKELSTPTFEPGVAPSAGAKRAAMALTAGFAMGPLAAGLLAQWGPYPGKTPFVLHWILSVLWIVQMRHIPETARLHGNGSILADLATRTVFHRTFAFIVAPLAPWVFGAAFTANAILPARMQEHVEFPIAYTAIATALTLGTGFAIQQIGPQVIGDGLRRGPLIALTLVTIGMALSAYASVTPMIGLHALTSIVLGLSYGVCLFTGLSFVQRIAPADELAALTGIFYCLTYTGMLFPAVLTKLGIYFPYPVMLGVGCVVAVASMVAILIVTKQPNNK